MSNTALYVIVVAIWGSTWLAIEFQLGVVSPEVSVFYRYLIAATLLFGWSKLRRLPLRFDRFAHLRFLLLGFFLFCINYILAYHAQRFVTSAFVAIVFSMMLWMNIVNTRLFFGTPISRNVIAGASLGICGVATMFWPSIRHVPIGDASVTGALLAIGGTYSASIGNMVSQSAQRVSLPVLQSNAWGMFYGATLCGIVVASSGKELLFENSVEYILSLLYLVVFGSIVGFGAYLQLLGRIGAHKAGYATVMFPVVALTLSIHFEAVVIDRYIVSGILLTLLGNYFVLLRNTGEKNEDVCR